MAYVDTRDGRRNYAALAAVGAVELALAYALITGLAAKFVPKSEPPIVGMPIPQPTMTPPVEPPVDERAKPRPTPQRDPLPSDPVIDRPLDPGPFDLPTSGPADSGGIGDGAVGEVVFPTPSPSPLPQFEARAPRPKGKPAAWVVTNDYPQAMIRAEAEGVVRFALTVGANGRATGCTVTGSSGFPALDQAACEKLIQRARFEPATDTSGAAVSGTYNGSLRWQLPKD